MPRANAPPQTSPLTLVLSPTARAPLGHSMAWGASVGLHWPSVLAALCLASPVAGLCYLQHRQLQQERQRREQAEAACRAEHDGRVRAEQRMVQAEAHRQAECEGRVRAEQRLAELQGPADGLIHSPIGYAESVFRRLDGTPQHGAQVPLGKARLELRPDVAPPSALEGLADCSHCWVVYAFHADAPAGARDPPPAAPGAAPGRSVGVFATRAPRGPGSIGLSLVAVDGVSGSCVHVSGVDLLDGTLVLDIKPYAPDDRLPAGAYAVPPWLEARPLADCAVRLSSEALCQLAVFYMDPKSRSRARRRSMYDSAEAAERFIAQVLRCDPRAAGHRGRAAGPSRHDVDLDVFEVQFEVTRAEVVVTTVFRNAERCASDPEMLSSELAVALL